MGHPTEPRTDAIQEDGWRDDVARRAPEFLSDDDLAELTHRLDELGLVLSAQPQLEEPRHLAVHAADLVSSLLHHRGAHARLAKEVRDERTARLAAERAVRSLQPALEDAVQTVGASRPLEVGDHRAHHPQVSERQVERWREALNRAKDPNSAGAESAP